MKRLPVMLLVALIAVSCAGREPSSPEISALGRAGQWFRDPWMLFGGVHPCMETDVAAILVCSNAGNAGTVWVDGSGVRWSVATSVLDQEAAPPTYIGYYRFLPQWPDSEADFGPGRACGWPGQCRYLKVSACYMELYGYVEVITACQWRPTEEDDWDILVERRKFDPDDFAAGSPADPMQPPSYWLFSEEMDQQWPDLAHDPESGDVYLVYSHEEVEGNEYRLYYRKGNREYCGEVTWGQKVSCQKTEGEDEHNGFFPRVDIGRVTVPGYTGLQLIGIAYTGQQGNICNVWINYWPIPGGPPPDMPHNHKIEDRNWADHNAGFATIDIGPPNTDFAAIAFIQAHSPNWQQAHVTFADSISYSFTYIEQDMCPYQYAAYPSVAIHQGAPYSASVSFHAWDGVVQHHWHPAARQVVVRPGGNVQLGDPTIISYDVHGYWNRAIAWDYDFGVNTSLVVYDDNSYWMVWSSLIDTPGPEYVHGAFGYTDPPT